MSTLAPKRRHYGYESTRQAILDAAREIMRESGVGALTLHEVARRVSMKTPSLYTYFESKHALYDALFAQGMKLYTDYNRRIIEEAPSFDAAVEAGIEAYMRFADDNPDLYPLLFERPVPGFVPSPEAMQEISALTREGIEAFQTAIDGGTIRTGLSAAQSIDLYLALVHGLTALKRANEPDAPIGEGRFGSLLSAAADLLRAAWFSKKRSTED
jgi:AcrR family transcriptional regulator